MKLEKPPTAIISYTEVVPGILQALQQINLKVGEDVSLICYEDLEIAKTNNPPLTVMCPQVTKAGERLVGILMEIFNGRPVEDLQEIWQVEIVHRRSSDHI